MCACSALVLGPWAIHCVLFRKDAILDVVLLCHAVVRSQAAALRLVVTHHQMIWFLWEMVDYVYREVLSVCTAGALTQSRRCTPLVSGSSTQLERRPAERPLP